MVIGEGENTIVDLMNALNNKTLLSQILGIAYKSGDRVQINQRMPHSHNSNFVMSIISEKRMPLLEAFAKRK